MAGDSLGSLVVKIAGDMSELKTAMDKAQYAAEQTFEKITAAGKKMQAAMINTAVSVGAGMVAGFAITEIKAFVDQTIEATAALKQMAERSGATVESLSAIRSAAKLTGTDLGGVESALIKMAKGMTGADDQTKGFGGALKYLGTSAKDSQGALKSTDQMFMEIATSLDRYADGAGKTALAQALFGKAGAQLIPVLKELAIAGEYNVKVTTEQAEAAEEYERNLKRLAAIKSAVAKQIVIEFIPAMNDLAVTFLRAQKESDGLRAQLGELVKDGSVKTWAESAAMWVAHVMDTFLSAGADIKVALSQVKISLLSFQEHATRMLSQGWENPLSKMFAGELAKEEAYLAQLKINSTKAHSYYQTMLGQQQAGRAEGGNLSGLDAVAQAYGGKQQANPDLGGDKAAKGVDLIAQALKYYGEVLGQLNGIEKEYTNGMEKLMLLYNARLITTQQLTVAEKFLYDTKTLAGQEISKLALENQKIEDQIALITRAGTATVGAAEAAANYAVTYGKLKNLYEAEKDRITALARQQDLDNTRLTMLKELEAAQKAYVASLIQSFDAERQWRESLRQSNDDAFAAAFNFNAALTEEIALLGATTAERERAIAVKERNIALQNAEVEGNTALIQSIKNVYAERLQLIDSKEAKAALLDMQKTAQASFLEMSNSLTDTLLSAWEALKGGAKAFTDWLKAEFAKLVLRPVIQYGVNTALGALGLGAAGSANASGGLLSGVAGLFASNSQSGYGGMGDPGGFSAADRSLNTNSIASLFEQYMGASSELVKGIGQVAGGVAIGLGVGGALARAIGGNDVHPLHSMIGTVVGGIIGSYWGFGGAAVGSAVGGIAGGILDGILNEGDAMRSARVGQGPGDYTYGSTGGKFGDIGIQRGSDKWFSDADMSATFNAWFRAIGKLDTEVAKHFSGEEITRAMAALTGQGMQMDFGLEHTGLDPEKFAAIIRTRFSTIFGVIDQQMADLIANFKGSGEDLLTLIVDLSTIHERLAGLHDSLSTLFGQDVGFADIAKLKGDTEGYTEALQRLAAEYGVTNQIADMLGKTQEEVWGSIGLASEGARAHLIELAGGLDKLSQQLDFYYTHFYSTAEQQAHTLSGLQDVFAGLGVQMPLTLDDFRALTDSYLAQGEAGAQASAILLAAAPSFYAYIGAIEAVQTSLNKNADAFRMIFGEDISLDAVRALQQNGELLTATLTRITSEFAATNELLSIFGLTSEQVFGAFGLASEAARAQLIEFSGGIDTFTARLASFYDHYFSEQEKQAANMARLNAVFVQVGIAMPTTVQGFRDAVLHFLAMGPAGAAAVAALLSVEGLFYDLYKPVTDATTALAGFISQMQGLYPVIRDPGGIGGTTYGGGGEVGGFGRKPLEGLTVAAQEAHDALMKLNDALTNSFRDAYRSIELAGLSNQQQYEYLQREAAGYFAQISTATSGEDVQSFAEKIRADMLSAFNLLAPDEQNARRQEFLDNLLSVSAAVTASLARLDPTGTLVGAPLTATPAEVAATQGQAASTQREAAEMQRQAAADMQEAAKAMLIAQQLIKRVSIDIPLLGATVEAGL